MLCLKYSSFLSCAILLTITAGMSISEYPAETHPKISQHKVVATWKEAKQHCESRGATLASPISKELIQYMKAIIAVNNHTTPYYIGFKARDNAEFMSEEGILLEDVPEAIDMVERLDPREGDCLSMDRHSIRVEPCWSRLPYMCYFNGTSSGVTTTTETRQCDPGYTVSTTGCYMLHRGQVAWGEAVSKCAAEGAHLVVVNDSDEAKVVADIVKVGIEDGFYSTWVGLRKDEDSQVWVAITGEQLDGVYHVWEGPQNDEPDAMCGLLWNYGTLDVVSCSIGLSFVCEK